MAKQGTQPVRVEIDERFFAEWFGWGWDDLIAYLSKQAAFAAYYARTRPKETP